MKTYLAISYTLLIALLSQPAIAGEDEIIVTSMRRAILAKDYAGSVTVLGISQLKLNAPVHPAELLNEAAGVNIHRGSGQEHLTSIRSPVLTGGAGAGSFLYLEDGVPLRAAGFSNVNGLFESGLKGSWGDLNLELALFAMRKGNFFFRNANGFNVVDGKTNHTGLELSFDAPVNDWVTYQAALR